MDRNAFSVIVKHILKWRQFAKLVGTYTEALQKAIAVDGRVHTTFSMIATTTSRLSSHDPNLQNIPVRTVEGSRIREAFIAAEGCQIIAADYSQIELRILAHMADIKMLQEAFKTENIDARVFFYPLSELPMFDRPNPNSMATSISQRAINLPSFHEITHEEQNRVVNILKGLIPAK